MNLTDRVTVIAIGINGYEYLPPLQGPESDVSSLKELMAAQTSTAVIPEQRFKTLVDVDSASLRTALTDYAIGRSAPPDIFFFFSGHATPIDQNDLGLCTIDTQIHPEAVLALRSKKDSRPPPKGDSLRKDLDEFKQPHS